MARKGSQAPGHILTDSQARTEALLRCSGQFPTRTNSTLINLFPLQLIVVAGKKERPESTCVQTFGQSFRQHALQWARKGRLPLRQWKAHVSQGTQGKLLSFSEPQFPQVSNDTCRVCGRIRRAQSDGDLVQPLAPSKGSINANFPSSFPLHLEQLPGNFHNTMEQGVISQREVGEPSVDFFRPKFMNAFHVMFWEDKD